MKNRRELITTGLCLIAAPAIVRAEWIMSVKVLRPDGIWVHEYEAVMGLAGKYEQKLLKMWYCTETITLNGHQCFCPFPNMKYSSAYGKHDGQVWRRDNNWQWRMDEQT